MNASQPPVSCASLAGLPVEIRNEIFSYLLKERVQIRLPPARCPNSPLHPGPRSTRPAERATMLQMPKSTDYHFPDTEKQRAYLPTNHERNTSIDPSFLFSKQAISEVCRTFRAEVSLILRISTPLDVALEVHEFDFSQAEAFLSSLPRPRLEDFFVSESGVSQAKLRIDLRRPKDVHAACRTNLRKWLLFIDSMGAEELATNYRVTPAAHKEVATVACEDFDPILIELYLMHQAQARGAARLDLYQLLNVWWARRTVQEQLCCGRVCSKYPRPGDIPGLRERGYG